jgi:ATP-dependent Clp protease ATP-binding subunit ClpA
VFERFTERARQVVVLAQDEARTLRHNYIGTEHLLLGVLREEEGLGARVLESLQVTLEDVRGGVEEIVGLGEEVTPGQIPFTPRAKKVLELALREALSLGHNYIGTEHILLGLVREGKGVAATILADLGLDAERVRDEVIATLGPHAIGEPIADPGRWRFRARRGFTTTMTAVHPLWEYRVETHPLEQAWLNELGAEGWELVDIESGTLVFKRRCERRPTLRAAG